MGNVADASVIPQIDQHSLTKHEGLGNDFLIAVEPSRPLTAEDAERWCHRHRGIGADGLIMVSGPAADGAWSMVLWNADGSRAEISGNGIRCVAQAVARYVEADGPQTFVVDTDGGRRQLELTSSSDPATVNVRVDMGPAKPGPEPFDGWDTLGVAVQKQMTVDIGNPHLVALVEDPDGYDVGVIGPAVEAGYPDGLNVHLISVAADGALDLRVWERGAGITEACGSGACAAGWAATSWGLVDGVVSVRMPGGAANVELLEGNIILTGPATFIGEVILSEPTSG